MNELKPIPGLVLATIPETAQAVAGIEAAHADLMQTWNAVVQTIKTRRNLQPVGVDAGTSEIIDWRAWQATALRKFHAIRGELAGRMLLLCDEALARETAELREREEGIALGLGGLMHDTGAGQDLALLLRRVTGGLPGNFELKVARNRWHNMCRTSARP